MARTKYWDSTASEWKYADGGGSAVVWGGITGTLSSQTDVQDALDDKIDEPASEGTTGQVLTTDGNGGRSWTTVSSSSTPLITLQSSQVIAEDPLTIQFTDEQYAILLNNHVVDLDDGEEIVRFAKASTENTSFVYSWVYSDSSSRINATYITVTKSSKQGVITQMDISNSHYVATVTEVNDVITCDKDLNNMYEKFIAKVPVYIYYNNWMYAVHYATRNELYDWTPGIVFRASAIDTINARQYSSSTEPVIKEIVFEREDSQQGELVIGEEDFSPAAKTHTHSGYITSQDISGKEDATNKVTSWSATTTNTNYPSEKLVKDSLDSIFDDKKRFVCIGGYGQSYYSIDGLTWTAMNGLDTTIYYYDVIYSNDRFVCVGNNGKSHYSTDGLTWNAMTGLDNSYRYTGVTYGNGKFVCVSFGEKSYYSTDGITWTAMSGLDDSMLCESVAYGNGRFICVGVDGGSYYSADGLTWTAMSGLDTSKTYYDVAYGNDRFVCVGDDGSSYYSTDGLTWTAMSGLDIYKYYCGVTYGNDRFVCVGTSGVSYYSTNGTSWTAMSGLNTSKQYNKVVYGNGRFVCVGEKGLYYSDNNTTWNAITGLDTSITYSVITYGEKESHTHNDKYYTKSEIDTELSGKIDEPASEGTSGQVLTTDGNGGRTWTTVSSGGGVDISGKANINSPTFTGTPCAPTATAGTNTTQIATTAFVEGELEGLFDNRSAFVCVGASGKSYYSTDGTTWVAMSGLDTSKYYYDVAYGNNRFVCIGGNGESYYSTNGTSWTSMSGLDTSKIYCGVAYGNDRFVCVGYGGVSYYSTIDSTTWTVMSGLATSSSYNDITYGNDRFVCVGTNGSSYYSIDGSTWTTMSGLASGYYNSVTYGNSRFVCVGGDGKSYYSTDGLTWTAMSGLDSNYSYNSVTYGNGKFICVGNGNSYYSTDGTTWTVISGLADYTYMGITYGNGRFVCVGEYDGHSYYSTDGTTWNAMSGLDASKVYYGVTYGDSVKSLHVHNDGISYTTTAPSAANSNGLKFAVLDTEPATKYNGWIYIITG